MSERALPLTNRRNLRGEQQRIEAEIERLRRQSDAAAQSYQRELERLRQDYDRSSGEANEALRNTHRQALYRLCEGEMACMRSAVRTAADQPVDCDGKIGRADLRRYDPGGFEAAGQTLASDEAVFADARQLMIEDMRVLLHNLEHDRHGIDRLIDHGLTLHRAHVRRLRCLQAVSRGVKSRNYRQKRVLFKNGSLNEGIRALYDSRYMKIQVVLEITTPHPEIGRAQVTVKLLPMAAMDETLQRRMCRELSVFASGLLENQTYRPLSVSAGNVFRDQNQLYQAQVSMQYQI